MTKDEVRAIHPKSGVEIAHGCYGDLKYEYRNGGLYAVAMSSLGTVSDECLRIVAKSLVAKYGESGPSSTQTVRGDCGYNKFSDVCRALGGEQAIRYTSVEWSINGIGIAFRYGIPGNDWAVAYRPDPKATPDSISKF